MSPAMLHADGTVVTDIEDCARCGGQHKDAKFSPLDRPMAPKDVTSVVWGFWAPCPTNGQPMMLCFVPDAEPADAGGA